MKKIANFKVDHTKLLPGLYISRIDGDSTTYDMRVKKPNSGELLSNSQLHSFEHMFATLIRNGPLSERVIYFGPMGCQTGFYLLIKNAADGETAAEIKRVLSEILSFKGEVFGNSEIECGNYKNLDLSAAKDVAAEYQNTFTGLSEYKC